LQNKNQTDTGARMVLSREEMSLLRFSCEMHTSEGSPLHEFCSLGDSENFGRVAQGLVERGLAQAKTFQLDRALLRRLLIASQPEAKITLVRSEKNQHETLFEAYERAGVFMPFSSSQDRFVLDEPVLEKQLFETIESRFSPRGARGDLINLNFSLNEYFVFSVLAGDLRKRQRAHSKRVIAKPNSDISEPAIRNVLGRGPSVLMSTTVDDEGTPIRGMLRDLPPELVAHSHTPSPADWDSALKRLVKDDVISERDNRHALRPYLRDLAHGLCDQRRFVLTRLDFGAEDLFVKDLSIVDVPGSLFKIQADTDQRIKVTELSASSFAAEVWGIISPITSPDHEQHGANKHSNPPSGHRPKKARKRA
jgi:hypothetical protein